MKASNALPVQLYKRGVASFNNKREAGIDKKCFFQPFNCEDEIPFVLLDEFTTGSVSLQVLDEDGEELEISSFTRDSYKLSKTYEPVCDTKVMFNVVAPTVLQALSSWTNQSTGTSWSLGANPSVSISGAFAISKYLAGTFNAIAGETYTINYNFDLNTATGSQRLSIIFLNAAFGSVGINEIDTFTGVGNYTGYVNISPVANASYLAFRLYIDDDSGLESAAMDINSVSYNDGNVILFYSDYIDVKTHKNTRQIKFTNSLPFANIPYDDGDIELAIRVLSKFYKIRPKQEDESEPDGNGNVVKLSGTVKIQKLLEIEMIPPFMIEKLTLIFKHNSIWIENEAYIAEEPLEVDDLEDRSAFFNASIWLTRSEDNYVTNV